MTICPKCRLWNSDTNDRCSGCGHEFPSPVTPAPPVVPRTVRLDPKVTRLIYWALAVFAFTVVAACIALVWTFSFMDSSTDKAIQDWDKAQAEHQREFERQESVK